MKCLGTFGTGTLEQTNQIPVCLSYKYALIDDSPDGFIGKELIKGSTMRTDTLPNPSSGKVSKLALAQDVGNGPPLYLKTLLQGVLQLPRWFHQHLVNGLKNWIALLPASAGPTLFNHEYQKSNVTI